MTLSTTNTLFKVILYIWLLTIGRSIVIMLVGKKIFLKASKGEKSALIPIVNLFSMLEVADVSSFFGILFFVPVLNIIMLSIMSYEVGNEFNAGFFYKIGMIICPILFYWLLGNSKLQYKVYDQDYIDAVNNAGNNTNLLTNEEVEDTNDSIELEDNVETDSIFKSNVELMKKTAPYKAAKIDLLGMNKLKDKGTTKKEEKKEDVEVVDL